MEFGVVIPKEFASLHQHIPFVLEDGENEIPDLYRPTLQLLYRRLCMLCEDIAFLTEQIDTTTHGDQNRQNGAT